MKLQIWTVIALASTATLARRSSRHRKEPLEIVNLGYEKHAAIQDEDDQYLKFLNIRYGKNPERFGLPEAPDVVDEPEINYGTEEKRCYQSNPYWVPEALQYIEKFIFPNESIQKWVDMTYAGPDYKYPDVPEPQKEETEDCLFLDVVAPKEIYNNETSAPPEGAPVLVWFFGGGFVAGWKGQGSDPTGFLTAAYDKTIRGDSVPGTSVVHVAMNYRLGAYGWVAGDKFKEEGGVPNLGLHDQLLALEWVQNNIRAFGGDPSKVTVMGESAGSASILHHITAFEGEAGGPSFGQAILQSPGFIPQSNINELDDAYDKLLSIAEVDSLKDLKDISETDFAIINKKTIQRSLWGQFTFGPAVDGGYVKALPGISLKHKKFHNNVSIMTGFNNNEGLLFSAPFVQGDDGAKGWREYWHRSLPGATTEVIDYITTVLYPSGGIPAGSRPLDTLNRRKAQRLANALSDAAVICNTMYLHHALDNDTYSYTFSVYPSIHGQDVGYTWYPTPALFPVKDSIALRLQGYLTNFIKTGNPKPPGATNVGALAFDKYGPTGYQVALDDGVYGQGPISFTSVEDKANEEHCAWWQDAHYAIPKLRDGLKGLGFSEQDQKQKELK